MNTFTENPLIPVTLNMFPPTPPLNEINLGDGKFEYVKDSHIQSMLQNAYAAIQISEAWNFIRKDPGSTGFMYSKDPMVYKIMKNMEKCKPEVGHSGASFGYIMREMQFLACYGVENYKKNFIS
jgi:transcription antitermination factor NusG